MREALALHQMVFGVSFKEVEGFYDKERKEPECRKESREGEGDSRLMEKKKMY